MLPPEIVVIRPADTPVVSYRDLFRIRAVCPACWSLCVAYETQRRDLGNGSALIAYRFMGHARAASLRDDLARIEADREAA
jgi:hypothetical protein